MRTQATDTAAPAQASVQPRTARRLVDMLYMSEAETRQLFLDAEILIRAESGGYRISSSSSARMPWSWKDLYLASTAPKSTAQPRARAR